MSIAQKAAAQDQETIRHNVEHNRAVALAPAKWLEVKAMFNSQAKELTEVSSMTFSCSEPDELTLHVRKFIHGSHHRAIDLMFRPDMPGVAIKQHFNVLQPLGMLEMVMCGPHLVYSSGGTGVVLDELVQQCFTPLMGW